MAIKIIQDTPIPRLAPAVGVAATSTAIALKSGYLRVTIGSTTGSSGGYIAIGTNPSVTQDSYHITSYSVDIIKERIVRAPIIGITTGTTTVLQFDSNVTRPFQPGDYLTIENAPTVGLNTSHNAILSMVDQYVTIAFNSSAITSPNISGATVARSVKVACLTYEPDTFFNIAEVVTLVSE